MLTTELQGTPVADHDGAEILNRVRDAIRRYVVFPSDEASDAVALWIAATHGQPAWEHATRLGITGTKRCGKSRLLELVKALSYRAVPAVYASTAALYRSITPEEPPTILFDEIDTIFGSRKQSEASEGLRALINAGYSRDWPVLRCAGASMDVAEFDSFAMVALAGIGDLPDTIADRAVNIQMRRRATHERIESYRIRRDQPPLLALRNEINRWVRANITDLRDAEPVMPVDDRAADTWEPLIAIADVAGGGWPERARSACEALESDETDITVTRLLADIRTVFADANNLHTATILKRLYEIDGSPWAEKALSSRGLSNALRQVGIRPRDVRETGGGPNRKGYRRGDLSDAFALYLPTDREHQPCC